MASVEVLGQNMMVVDPGNGGNPATGEELAPPLVASPILDVTKVASSLFVYPGEVFNYTITISNVSPVPTSNPFTVSDNLPPGLSLSGTPTSTVGTVVNGGSQTNLLLSVNGEIPANSTATVTIPVVVADGANLGELTANTAVVNPGNGGDLAQATEETPPIVGIPDLRITKIADELSLNPATNNTFNYTISITNASDIPTSNPFTVTDVLPPNVVLNGTPTSTAGPVINNGDNQNLDLSIGGSIPAGATVTVTIPVVIGLDTPPGILDANTATVDPGNSGSLSSGTETTPPTVYIAQISGSKSASVGATYEGGSFFYTLTLTNTGNAPTSDPFTVEDIFPANVTLNGAVSSPTKTITPSGSTGVYDVTPALLPGETMTLIVPVVVAAGTPLGALEPNIGIVMPDTDDPTTTTTITETTPPVVSAPVITMTKESSATFVIPGEIFNYTLQITNNGLVPTSNPFNVTDVFPPNVTLAGTPTSSAGVVTNNGDNQNLDLSIAGSVAPGATVSITIPVQVSAGVPIGALAPNTATVAPGNGGDDASAIEVTPPVVDIPSLEVTKTSSIETAHPGETFNYEITITNNSNVPLSNPFTITDPLPPNVTLNGQIGTSTGTVTNLGDNQNLNLSVGATVGPGQSITLTIPVIIAFDAPIGPLGKNAATVVPGNGGQSEVGEDQNPPIIYAPVISMTKRASVSNTYPNGNFYYTVTITNTGNFPTSDPLLITDILPVFVESVGEVTVDTGTIVNTGTVNNLVLSYTPALAPGATITLTIPVTVQGIATPGQLIANQVTVYPGNGGTETTAVDPLPPFILMPIITTDKVASSQTLYPGESYFYQLTITNTSNVPTANPITVVDTLPPGVTLTGEATTNTGSAVDTSGTSPIYTFLIYDSLPPNTSITLLIPVTVSEDTPGGQLAPNTATVDPGNSGQLEQVEEVSPPVVDVPSLTVTKTSTPTTVVPNEVFNYVVTITNDGLVQTADPVHITDVLPPYLSLSGAPTSDSGTVVNTGNNQALSLDLFASIGPGETVVITIPVVVAANAPNGLLGNNTAVVDGGNGSSVGAGTDTSPPTVAYPILEVAKVADETVTYPCGTFNYIVTVTNSGGAPTANPLTFTDYLPTFVSLNGPVTSSSGTVTNAGDNQFLDLSVATSLAVGETLTLTIPVMVACDAPNTQINRNAVVVIGGDGEKGAGNETNPPLIEGNLPCFTCCMKTSAPSKVKPCETITYTISATNTGTALANTFIVTDYLPQIMVAHKKLSYVTLIKNSVYGLMGTQTIAVCTTGTAQCPIFTLVDGNNRPLSVPIGTTVKIIFQVMIPEDAVSGQRIFNCAKLQTGEEMCDNGVLIEKERREQMKCRNRFCCGCCRSGNRRVCSPRCCNRMRR